MKSRTNQAAATTTGAMTMNNRTNKTNRDAFKRLKPEVRAAIVNAVEQVFNEALATLAAFINQPDDEHEPSRPAIDVIHMTDRDFLDLYGYPASWDDEVPQPRVRPTPAGVVEAMLRDTAWSSDEMDAGLFEGFDHE